MDATAIWTLLKGPARVVNRLQRELMRVPPLRQLDEAAWRRARAEHAAGLPAARPGDAPVLSALEEVGVAVTSLEELGLPGVDRLLESIGAVERTLNRRARRVGSFTRYPLEPVLYRTPLLVSAALDEHLLDLAHRHIGLPRAPAPRTSARITPTASRRGSASGTSTRRTGGCSR